MIIRTAPINSQNTIIVSEFVNRRPQTLRLARCGITIRLHTFLIAIVVVLPSSIMIYDIYPRFRYCYCCLVGGSFCVALRGGCVVLS